MRSALPCQPTIPKSVLILLLITAAADGLSPGPQRGAFASPPQGRADLILYQVQFVEASAPAHKAWDAERQHKLGDSKDPTPCATRIHNQHGTPHNPLGSGRGATEL
mmetsp:Transcript_6837/g.19294  ORF Transcript_6837/g.19294 Transcript_6837/m.19294 type:complete len:107 (+) Transcript_6837:2-322(+)